MLRRFIVGLWALALPLAALAGAVVESVQGNAQAGAAAISGKGQRIAAPSTIVTEAGAQVFLRFDDGMQIVVSGNSLLRVLDFHYEKGAHNRAVLELLRGAARVVTGAVAKDNPKQFFFRTPHTELTVERPADFTVALVNPAYITVNSGSVLSSNGWGAVPLNAGTTSAIASNAAAPASISASSLPASASSAMGNLSVVSVSAPAGGVAPGVGAVAGGVGGAGFAVPIVVIGAGLAGAAALIANDNDTAPAQQTTTTHH